MSRTTPSTQAESILKLLLTVLAEPRLTADEIGRAMQQSEAWVNQTIVQFRSAGLAIEYDAQKRRYAVGLDSQLESKLKPYAKKLAKVIRDSELSKPRVKFVSEQDTYTVVEWAQAMNTSPSNVANMINEYKGQRLPAGWVAYQLKARSKWYIKRMNQDRNGTKFILPDSVEGAFDIRIGAGEPADISRKQALNRHRCSMPGCTGRVLARGFCSPHYYQQRKHPENFPTPLASDT